MNEAIVYILIAVALFIGYSLYKKKKAKRPTKASTPWVISHGTGVLVPQGLGWYVDLPDAPEYLAYVSWLNEPRLVPGQSIYIKYKVEGGPIKATEYPDSPADCGVMIQRRGDNLSARGEYAGYRWFSHVHMPLTEGEHEYTLHLNDFEWGPVENDSQAASFADCLKEADSLNIVFGGAGGRGHGVNGPARFTLLAIN